MQLAPGTMIDKYRVLRHIGEGGMAAVYEVENSQLGNRFAAKVMSGALQHSRTGVERFLREAGMMASLNHPNIVRVFDVLPFNGIPVIIMELLRGESLAERVDRGGRPTQQDLIELATQMLEALRYAHERGIVHRDVKPDNIFCEQLADGRQGYRLMDFGIARSAEDQSLTSTGQFIGTRRYASPEQIQDPRAVDGRSDLFSLGVTLWEVATGIVPWSSLDSEFEMMRAIVHHPAYVLPASEFDPRLVGLVQRLTANAREQRVPTAADALRLLVEPSPSANRPARIPTGTVIEADRLFRPESAVGRQSTVMEEGYAKSTKSSGPPTDSDDTGADLGNQIASRKWRGVLLLGVPLLAFGLVVWWLTPGRSGPAATDTTPAPLENDGAATIESPRPAPPPAVVNIPQPATPVAVPVEPPTGPPPTPAPGSDSVAPASARPVPYVLFEGMAGQMNFSRIPAGSFRQGIPGETDLHRTYWATISHDFLMGRTEVTQAQWAFLAEGNNPSEFWMCGEDCPVENVDWYSTLAFANRLSDHLSLPPCYGLFPAGCADSVSDWADGETGCTGATFVGPGCLGYRLPTESEWEYAARAGTTTAYSWGDSPDAIGMYAWYRANSNEQTHPVSMLRSNAYGLYDMSGNVYEWCWDWAGTSDSAGLLYPAVSATDYTGPSHGARRALRGGSWNYGEDPQRVGYRSHNVPNYRRERVGFRLVRTLP